MDTDLESIRIKGSLSILKMHFWVLIKKRLIYFKRDYKGVFCEIVLPILIISFGLIFTLISFVKDLVHKDYTPAAYYKNTVYVWANTQSTSGASQSQIDVLLDKMSGVDKWNIANRIQSASISEFEKTLLHEPETHRYVAYVIPQRVASMECRHCDKRNSVEKTLSSFFANRH